MLERRLIEYVSQQAGVPSETVHAGTPIFSDGLLDSLAVMDLTVFVEREAGIRIPVSDVSLDNLDSVASIMRYLDRRNGRS